MRKVLFLLIFLVITTSVYSQKLGFTTKNKKAEKYFEKAFLLFKDGKYDVSLKLLNKAIKKDSEFAEAYLLKGDIFVKKTFLDSALIEYKKALKIDNKFFPWLYVKLGKLSYEKGDFNASIKYYSKYLELFDASEKNKKFVNWLISVSEKGKRLLSANKTNTVIILDSTINTNNNEYINFVSATDSLIKFTRKITDAQGKADTENHVKENICYSVYSNGKWRNPELINVDWAKGKNIGAVSYSLDGNTMYFAGCGWERGYGSCDIYCSKKVKGKWSTPVNLGKNINTKGWESQPVVSSDGKRLFFSSRRRGGKGGSDIWVSEKMKNGEWGLPVNLGDNINTGGNEMSPFLYADGNTLVFSSNGYPFSLGGMDLFISRTDSSDRWIKAQNMGPFVNSVFNDINLVYSLNGKYVWLSSDRKEGDFNIFKIPVNEEIEPFKILYINGKVLDSISGKGVVASVILTDLNSGFTIDSIHTDLNGTFVIVINPGGNYAFNILANGYLPLSKNFDFAESEIDDWKYHRVFYLKPAKPGEKFVLRNIYFDTDKYELNPKSFTELNRLVDFLNQNKSLNLEISGHTDNVGTESYNKRLSLKRAKSVYDYLINKGISSKRLSFKGYGSSKPKLPNNSGKNRQFNRRVEFMVLEK